MTTFPDADLGEIDVLGADFVVDPAAVYDAALAKGPVVRCPFGAMVIGHSAVRSLLRDENAVPAHEAFFAMFGVSDGPYKDWFSTMLLNRSGEDHARLRRLLSKSFSARQAERARPMMREVLTELLDELVRNGPFDFVHAFGAVYPIRVFCRLIGVPQEDVARFSRWAEALGQGFDMDLTSVIDEMNDAVASMYAYVEQLLATRAAGEGDDDLIGSLLAVSEDGDRLTRDELVNLITLLLSAGYDTTANELAWGMVLLAQRPDLLTRLASEPSLAPQFVEELLRIHPAAATGARLAVADIDCDGVAVPAGTFMMVSFHGAARDPSVYKDPGTFDLDRQSQEPLLSFGWGEHYCLGVHIARAELEEFFAELTSRVRHVQVTGAPDVGNPLGIYHVRSLPIELTLR